MPEQWRKDDNIYYMNWKKREKNYNGRGKRKVKKRALKLKASGWILFRAQTTMDVHQVTTIFTKSFELHREITVHM